MLAAAKLLVAGAVAYVLFRAGWIFGGGVGLGVAVVVLAAIALGVWRRGQPAVAAGIALGALSSALALSL